MKEMISFVGDECAFEVYTKSTEGIVNSIQIWILSPDFLLLAC